MIKFELQTYVNGQQTQNFDSQIIASVEKFTKLNESTLQKIADKLKQGIESNLQKGQNISGGSVAPKKIPNGKPIFQSTGQLLNSVTEQQFAKSEWNIFFSANRSQIATYLQTGTNRMVAREFFGISPTVNKEIDSILDKSFSTP